MPDPNISRAAERARWLAKLEAALKECDRLSSKLLQQKGSSPEAIEIRREIAEARRRVDEIRRARPAATPLRDPTQIHEELATWRGNRDD